MLSRPFLVWCLLSVIWGSTWLVIKVGVQDLPPFGFAGIRFLVAAIPLWLVLRMSGRRLPRSLGEWTLVAWTGLVMISLQYGLIFWAEVRIPSGVTAILYTIMPLFGMVFAHALLPEERMSLAKTSGVLLGILGVSLVFADQWKLPGRDAALGCVAILLAAALASLASVMIKARGRSIDSLALTVGQMTIGFVPLLGLGLVIEGSPFGYRWTVSAGLSLLYLALVGSALAFVLLYWLIKRMDVTKTQLIPLSSTFVAILLGRVVLGERLTTAAIFGATSIFLGLLVTRWGFERRE